MVTTLKKSDIQKIKKWSPDIVKKLLNPKFGPNPYSSFRGIDDTDRQTCPPPKTTFFEY